MLSLAPVVTLLNSLRVANFSSPHPFNFTTGEVLPACEKDRVIAGELICEEELTECRVNRESPLEPGKTIRVENLQLTWRLTETIQRELTALECDSGVDIVLVPFPLLSALREAYGDDYRLHYPKVRVIRCADRITKAIYPDRFCI